MLVSKENLCFNLRKKDGLESNMTVTIKSSTRLKHKRLILHTIPVRAICKDRSIDSDVSFLQFCFYFISPFDC